jgi:hypothetical protein
MKVDQYFSQTLPQTTRAKQTCTCLTLIQKVGQFFLKPFDAAEEGPRDPPPPSDSSLVKESDPGMRGGGTGGDDGGVGGRCEAVMAVPQN